jgi:micrococcal nuclease
MGLFRILVRVIAAPSAPPRRIAVPHLPDRTIPREMRIPFVRPNAPPPAETVVSGRCWVVDGDTIVIDRIHIRLAGIDAPELDHPWGQQSKWAMVRLCKGQTITARIRPEMSYERVVAECFLPDGRDLAAELVKAGLALDWPKFSGGKYRHLEPADARKKLWRANLRQGGMIGAVDDMLPIAGGSDAAPLGPRRKYRLGWLAVSGLLLLLVGCQLVDGNTGQNAASARTTPPAATSFAVGE